MADAMAQDDASGFDLLDTQTFANGHPHRAYDHLRSHDPVFLHPGSDRQPPLWVLTRFDDIRAVSLDGGENFTSSRGFRISTDNRASMSPEIGRALSRFMLSMDRPAMKQCAVRLLAPKFVASNFVCAMKSLTVRLKP